MAKLHLLMQSPNPSTSISNQYILSLDDHIHIHPTTNDTVMNLCGDHDKLKILQAMFNLPRSQR